MNLTNRAYQKLLKKDVPPWLERNNPLMLVWCSLRKWINVSVIPFIPFNSIRIVLYRMVGFRIGRNVFIGMQCYLDDMHPDRMAIEDDVVISYRVTIACHGPRSDNHRLILKKGCYIGCNATLIGGRPQGDVVIGEYASVGACALVYKSVPPLTKVAGIPAYVIRQNQMPWAGDDHRLKEIMQRLGIPEDNYADSAPNFPHR